MEDPVRIDLWGRLQPSKRDAALIFLRAHGAYPSEIELRKALVVAAREGPLMVLAQGLGYAAAMEAATAAGEMFDQLTYCQEDYGPDAPHCQKHNFHFGGGLGCHICRGFYAG